MTNEVEASLAQSFGEVLVRLAGERPGLLVVSGPDTSLVSWFTQIWPERLVTVAPAASRLSVGQGIRRGGGEAIVVLDETVSVLPSVMTAPMVLLSADRMHLGAAHRAGTTVCQPGWELDLPALLIGALGADEPVVLHLPEPLPGLPEQPDPERTSFGDPRVLHRGRGEDSGSSVKAGTLDDTSGLHPVGHIWAASAQPWMRLDGLVYDHQPDDSYAALIEAFRAQRN